MTTPEIFDTITLPKGGIEALPPPSVPYYVIAQEGPFLHKHTEIGDALLRQFTPPKSLPALGSRDGSFTWRGDKVPDWLIAQAHDFFKRIYTRFHTEAEVLITKNFDTGEFRLFVPYQRVSGQGVKSIYEPTHIARGWAVVGTLHSHCMMGAFHSGTDSGDASDMDGVHFTIGKVLDNPPEIVAMVAMSGTEFHYKPDEIADIDWAHGFTSPEWWDAFVFANNNAPREKPKSLISLDQSHWDQFLGIELRKPKPYASKGWSPAAYPPGHPGFRPSGQPAYSFQTPQSGRQTTIGEYKDRWETDWSKWAEKPSQFEITDPQINIALDIAEEYGVLSEDDWTFIKTEDIQQLEYWQGYFTSRLANLHEVMGLLGLNPDGTPISTTTPARKPRRPRR